MCQEQEVTRVAMPCAEERHGGFEARAAAAGLEVTPLLCYRLVDAPRDPAAVPADLDAFLFTSPSAAVAWREVTGGRADVRAVAIGGTTTDALHDLGFDQVTTLSEPTPAALVDAITHLP